MEQKELAPAARLDAPCAALTTGQSASGLARLAPLMGVAT